MLLAHKLHVLFRDVAALAGHAVDEAVALKLVICARRRYHADAQVLCQRPNGWQRVVGLQFAGNDLFFDLPHNLHAQVYCDIIHAGKHFLGGKPFGIDKAANDQILQAIREH